MRRNIFSIPTAAAAAALLVLAPGCASDRDAQREADAEQQGTGGAGFDPALDTVPDDRSDAATVPEAHSGMLDPDAESQSAERPFREQEPGTGGGGEDPMIPLEPAPTLDPAPPTEGSPYAPGSDSGMTDESPAGVQGSDEDQNAIGEGTELLEPNEPGTVEQGQVNDDPLQTR